MKSIYVILFLFISCVGNDSSTGSEAGTSSRTCNCNSISEGKTALRKFDKANGSKSDMSSAELYSFFTCAFKINDEKKLIYFLDRLTDDCASETDSIYSGRAYKLAFTYYSERMNHKKALPYYNHAYKILAKIKNKTPFAHMLLDHATMQLSRSNYLAAEGEIFTVIHFINRLPVADQKLLMYRSLTTLGIIYCETNDFEDSFKYYRQAMQFLDDINTGDEHLYKEITLNNIGFAYLYSQNYTRAVHYFKKGILNPKLVSMPDLNATLVDNLAYSEFMISHKPSAIHRLKYALTLREELGIVPGMVMSYIHLMKYYSVTNDLRSAKEIGFKGYKIAKKYNMITEKMILQKQMFDIDSQYASNNLPFYKSIADSLQLAESRSTNQFARIAYEAEELTKEKDEAVREKQFALGFLIVTSVLITLAIVRRVQKNRQQDIKQVQLQHELDETFFEIYHETVQKVEQARFAEKKRIARELHDGVMNQLSSARLNLYSLASTNDPADVDKYIEYVNDIKQIEREICRIAKNIHDVLCSDNTDFTTLLSNYIDEQQPIMDAHLSFTINPEINWNNVANGLKINIYRIVQESLQNVRKYAHASTVQISIEKLVDDIHLTISDDGVGFDNEAVGCGIGLQNIRERAAEFSGAVAIMSKKGEGTKILVRFADSCPMGKSA